MSRIDSFKQLLAAGMDNALLRYSLGNEYLQTDQPVPAIEHLRIAVTQDPGYSAAWKLLGKALATAGDMPGASEAFRRGIAVAEQKGDKQAAKEMQVFVRRLERPAPDA